MLLPLFLEFIAPMDASFVGWSAAMFAAGGFSHGTVYACGRLLLPDRRI
jgi:hypothetical protein